jgi:hypothetical protein
MAHEIEVQRRSTRNGYIIAYHPNATLPWYVSARTYDELGLPIPGQTLAECRDVQIATRLVDSYVSQDVSAVAGP